eukprot:m.944705 g.944705  ORF g.944705 m.944705 type:complete len:356 (-) comp23843_c0_seq41:1297-2364(-)
MHRGATNGACTGMASTDGPALAALNTRTSAPRRFQERIARAWNAKRWVGRHISGTTVVGQCCAPDTALGIEMREADTDLPVCARCWLLDEPFRDRELPGGSPIGGVTGERIAGLRQLHASSLSGNPGLGASTVTARSASWMVPAASVAVGAVAATACRRTASSRVCPSCTRLSLSFSSSSMRTTSSTCRSRSSVVVAVCVRAIALPRGRGAGTGDPSGGNAREAGRGCVGGGGNWRTGGLLVVPGSLLPPAPAVGMPAARGRVASVPWIDGRRLVGRETLEPVADRRRSSSASASTMSATNCFVDSVASFWRDCNLLAGSRSTDGRNGTRMALAFSSSVVLVSQSSPVLRRSTSS